MDKAHDIQKVADLQSVARSIGVEVLSDPEPERRALVRSDQNSFIRCGVPAISLKVGFVKDSPEHEIVKRWRRERDHAPSDDLQQPIDFEAAAKFNRAYLQVVEAVAKGNTTFIVVDAHACVRSAAVVAAEQLRPSQ